MDIVQIIWLLIPALYYAIALWGYLEKKGRSVKKQNPGDFLKQGTFILVAVGITFLVDIFLAEDLARFLESILPLPLMPLLLLRLILLPVILLVVATMMGGSKAHSIKRKTGAKRR